MIHTNPIIQTKICAITSKEFSITQGDLDFYAKISPTFAGQKFQIPTPTLCPEERQRRRLSFRNERNLYRRTCDASGKQIISIYKPDPAASDGASKPYKVYDQKIRRSDVRDPMDYGMNFDFSKTFMEQFGELMFEVPRCSIININSENSEYTNICANNKNCYIIIESSNNEDCMYSYWIQKSKDLIDCSMVNNSSICFQSNDLENCHKLFFSEYCRECSSSYFLKNCTNCNFCFWCHDIEWKQYRIFNKQSTKEELEQITKDFTKHILKTQEHNKNNENHKHIRNSNTITNSDYIYDAENIHYSKEIHDAKNVYYSKHVWFNSWDCYDVDTVWYNSFLMYESINTALDAYNNKFCMRCRSWCHDLLYCDNCDSSSNLFWCIGLRNKSYCIFNKQYTKDEYETTVAHIIAHMQNTGEWWEFFHPSLSPFGYNETVAQEYYPAHQVGTQFFASDIRTDKNLSLQEFWYHRSDYQAPSPVSDKVIQWKDLPTTITEVQDDILQYAIACEVTGKLFRLQPQELAFYHKHNIPLPRKHPDQRHLERLQLRK
jgi:hypothetical protein